MSRPARRKALPPSRKTAARETPRPATTDRTPKPRLFLLLVLGILLVGIAAVIRYRVGANPVLRIPPVETKDLLPLVAKEIEEKQAAIVAEPAVPQVWGEYGLVLLAHGFRLEAGDCFAEAERLAPHDYRWPYYFGMTMGIWDTEKSLHAFERAVEDAPDRVTVRLRLAEWLFDLRQLDACRRHTQQSLEQEPDSPRAQLLMARLRLQEGKTEESLQWVQRAASSPKGNRRDVYELLARVHQRLGHDEAALAAVNRMESLPPGVAVWDDPEMGVGATYLKDASILNTLANIQRARGGTEEWLGLLQKVVATQPDDVIGKEKLAQALVDTQRYQEAKTYIDKSLAQHPESAQLEYLRGRIDLAQEQTDAARQRFERAIELKPDYAEAFMGLGQALSTLNQHAEAIRALEVSTRLSPSSVAAYDYLSQAQEAAGLTGQAIETLQHVVELHPSQVTLAVRLAQMMLDAGRPDEAQEVLRACMKAAQDPTDAQELLKRIMQDGSRPPAVVPPPVGGELPHQ